MPVHKRLGVFAHAGCDDQTNEDDVIASIDRLLDATIEPTEDTGQDGRTRDSFLSDGGKFVRTFFVGAFAGEEIGDVALVFGEDVDGKKTRGTDHGTRTRAFVRAKQDKRWVEGHGRKRTGGHAKKRVVMGCRDKRDAGGELSKDFAKRVRFDGHVATVGWVGAIGEVLCVGGCVRDKRSEKFQGTACRARLYFLRRMNRHEQPKSFGWRRYFFPRFGVHVGHDAAAFQILTNGFVLPQDGPNERRASIEVRCIVRRIFGQGHCNCLQHEGLARRTRSFDIGKLQA